MSDQLSFRRVHRLTPLLRLWSVILALIAAFALNVNLAALRDIFAFITGEHRGEALRDTALALAGFIAVCAVVWLVSGLWWRRMGYRLGAEELSLRRGLLSVQLRTARYDRTQAVDVVEPVIARLFRLAAVRVETAGGQSSVIEIAYLKKADAEALRDDILARVHGAPICRTGRRTGPRARNPHRPLPDCGRVAYVHAFPRRLPDRRRGHPAAAVDRAAHSRRRASQRLERARFFLALYRPHRRRGTQYHLRPG
ncbi:PH domain-containing protein [Corynebacterium sp.]|uniref:PH domain-containing protein n=1 Tax=Corynebacterium sp. TaxID=1720 RepID=UPI0037BF184C